MLLNNMETVFKIFFKGMTTLKIDPEQNMVRGRPNPIEANLQKLEDMEIVKTRVRNDTGVKQYHAGQIFDYLKNNIELEQN